MFSLLRTKEDPGVQMSVRRRLIGASAERAMTIITQHTRTYNFNIEKLDKFEVVSDAVYASVSMSIAG